MTDFTPSHPTMENSMEYEALAEKLLADMQLLDAQMQRDRIEIDRLKAETNLLKARSACLEAETRAVLTRLKAAV